MTSPQRLEPGQLCPKLDLRPDPGQIFATPSVLPSPSDRNLRLIGTDRWTQNRALTNKYMFLNVYIISSIKLKLIYIADTGIPPQ